MPLKYYYNDNLRWSYFWENPNCAAAFLSCLLGWLWWMGAVCQDKTGQRRVFLAVFCALCAVELAVWFLLAKTYSRGGLVAAVAGLVFFYGLRGMGNLSERLCPAAGRSESLAGLSGTGCQPVGSGGMGDSPMKIRWHGRLARVLGFNYMDEKPMPLKTHEQDAHATFTGWKPVLLNLFARFAAIAIICTAVGFSSRLSPGYMVQDGSVLNRLELWKDAMVMMHDSPFHGWGKGLGGMGYINWYQPLEATVRPVGFVNSYFEVAVEYGTHVLFLALLCMLALVFLAAKQRTRSSLALAGGSVLVVWLTANLLTSLWADYPLWILPAISALCVVVYAVRTKTAWKPILAISGVASLVVCGLLLFAGGMLSKTREFRAKPLRQLDAVLVTKRETNNAAQPSCEVWVDGAVFGNFWGKSLRPILSGSATSKLLVYAPWVLGEMRLDENTQVSIYSGFQVDRIIRERKPAGKTIILHPRGFPPVADSISKAETVVCLPAVDTSSDGLPWRIWAEKHAARLLYSPQGGAQIKPSTNLPFWRALLSND